MAQKLLTREKYKKLKKMDRQEAEGFILALYQEAYNNGKADNPTLDFEKLYEKLLEIKGVGKVKADCIVETIKELLDNNGGFEQ